MVRVIPLETSGFVWELAALAGRSRFPVLEPVLEPADLVAVFEVVFELTGFGLIRFGLTGSGLTAVVLVGAEPGRATAGLVKATVLITARGAIALKAR